MHDRLMEVGLKSNTNNGYIDDICGVTEIYEHVDVCGRAWVLVHKRPCGGMCYAYAAWMDADLVGHFREGGGGR